MSEKLETLIEQLGKLTVVEALELSKKLEEAWGVSATVGASAPAAGGAPVEEKAEVDVILNLTAGMGGDMVFGSVDSPLPYSEKGTDMAGADERVQHLSTNC